MSSKRFSFFKSKPKKSIPKIFISGYEDLIYQTSQQFSDKIKREKHSELSRYNFFSTRTFGGRSPLRSLLDFHITGAVGFIFVFKMPPDEYSSYFFESRTSDFDYIMDFTKESGNIVLVLNDYENEDEFGQDGKIDSPYEEWVKKVTEKNRVGRFDVSTKSERGMDEAYQWLKEQLLLDIKRMEEVRRRFTHSEKKISGFRWLGKLSKVALSFGANSS